MGRLDNKVAVITGGAGEIGAATAKLFVDEGAKVVLADLYPEALKKVADELASDNVMTVAMDVTKEADAARLVDETMKKHGRLDVYFVNAGIEGVVAPIEDQNYEDFKKVIAVNVDGVFLSVKHAIPAMRKSGGGSIMITSSVAGLKGMNGISPYVTSKHAEIGFARTAALELAKDGIRVNTIHPAPIDTRMMRSIETGFSPEDALLAQKQFEDAIPLGRYGQPVEVGEMALFLASDESRYSTGSQFVVDGGFIL